MVDAAAALDFSDLFQAIQPPKPKAPRSTQNADSADQSGRLSIAPSGEPPCLVLQHYATPPQVLFGEVAPRSSTTRTLLVRNESTKVQKLEVRGIEAKDALRVYPPSFEITAQSSREVTITWAPSVVGTLQKRLEMKWNGAEALHVQLRGSCARVRSAPSAPAGKAATARVGKTAATAAHLADPPRAPLSPSSANSVALGKLGQAARDDCDEGMVAREAAGRRPTVVC